MNYKLQLICKYKLFLQNYLWKNTIKLFYKNKNR